MARRMIVAGVSVLALGMCLAVAGPASAATVSVPFSYTGAAQNWTVPAGVTSATFDLYGAQGGDRTGSSPNQGGQATATIAVTPGQNVAIYVGGAGAGNLSAAAASGGFNGGGGGYSTGGGATDIRIGGATLNDRVLVAGGGGGDGNCFSTNGGVTTGGAGGGSTGDGGHLSQGCLDSFGSVPGGGGTQIAGGTSAAPCNGIGSFGTGGTGPSGSGTVNGGGGGGWFGGGSGCSFGGGGGGSGHGPAGTTFNTGVQPGNGKATITYNVQTLTVSRTGPGSGTITSQPPGIDCGTTCSADFVQGSSVTLTANAGAASSFEGWGGDCANAGSSCTVTMDQARNVTATFVTDKVLTVSKAGTASGTVTSQPVGIDCGSTCSASFRDGTLVQLSPTPDPGVDFTGWSGGCTGTDPCIVKMDQARNVTATFEPTVTALAVTPKVFQAGTKNTPLSRKAGTKIAVSVSGDALVRFSVRRNPNRKGPKITYSFTRTLAKGDHVIPFTGKLAGRAYRPGAFKLSAIAVDQATGHESAPRITGFRIKR